MSEMAGGVGSAGVAESVVATDAVAAGAMLRQAREAAGLHIAALAVALKVPVAKLEALECGDVEALPDMVFVRALASSVCRSLKVDAAPILALLPQVPGVRLSGNEAGINTPVKGATPKPLLPSASGSSSKVKWVVVALVLGTLVLLFLPQLRSLVEPLISPATAEKEMNEVGAQPPVPVVTASAEIAVEAMRPASVAVPMPAAQSPAASTPMAVAPQESTSIPTPATVDAGDHLLLLKASGSSWVQVRDGRGTVLLQRNLAAGESVPVTGALPLAVVIGRMDVTEVYVRGQPFNLSAVARENVARFEVK